MRRGRGVRRRRPPTGSRSRASRRRRCRAPRVRPRGAPGAGAGAAGRRSTPCRSGRARRSPVAYSGSGRSSSYVTQLLKTGSPRAGSQIDSELCAASARMFTTDHARSSRGISRRSPWIAIVVVKNSNLASCSVSPSSSGRGASSDGPGGRRTRRRDGRTDAAPRRPRSPACRRYPA